MGNITTNIRASTGISLGHGMVYLGHSDMDISHIKNLRYLDKTTTMIQVSQIPNGLVSSEMISRYIMDILSH